MTQDPLFSALEQAVACVALVWFFYRPWQTLMVMLYRQSLFEARDTLFLNAADGKIAFSDPAYQALRYRLNDMVRYADEFRLRTLLAARLAYGPAIVDQKRQPDRLRTLIGEIQNKHYANHLQGVYTRVQYLTVMLVVARSPLMLVTFAVLSPAIFVAGFLDFERIKSQATSPIDQVIRHEMPVGEMPLAA